MILPALPAATDRLYRVSAFHANVRVLSFLAPTYELALERARFLAPRWSDVEVSADRGEVVAAWRDGRQVESK